VAGRIVVFGATGYTGRLTVEALIERGQTPVLAGRSATKLADLAAELGGRLDMVVADVSRPSTIRATLERGDVLVSTVGPFSKWGDAAAEAAIEAGANYIDSTGEPPFIRRVFEQHGPAAAARDVGMLTAFGYDWVPGNLAGALALREAGAAATRVDTGYFVTGDAGSGSFSGGTRASLAGAVGTSSFAWRDGALRTERSAARVRSFDLGGHKREAVSVGSSEHFTLPRLHPGLREVNAYLGWFGPLSRPLQLVSLGGSLAFRIPGTRWLFGTVADQLVKGSTGGPGQEERARSGSHIIAVAYDERGEPLSQVQLTGPNAYSFTGRILAWAAERVAAGDLKGTGALGPADGFGLDLLEAGCAEAGIRRD
jgi:short subunit dehydrogenase-like uncharacterized protein